MSYLLQLLGRGLGSDLGEILDQYYWTPQPCGLGELEERCAKNHDDANLHLQLGLAYLQSSQLTLAVDHFRKTCLRQPDSLGGRLALAAALAEQRDLDRALEQLKIANQNHLANTRILFAIGFCLERLQRRGEAREYYRDAIERDGALTAARQRLAAIALADGNLAEGIEQYEALRRQMPDQPWVRSTLANLYYRDGQHARSIDEFEAAIAMEPENWSLIDEQVESLVADGQVREAIERLHLLIDNQGPFADVHCRLADLYSRTGDDQAALRYYQLALEFQPQYMEAWVKLGTHHLVQGRWDQSSESFSQASAINDNSMQNYVGMGVAQLAAGRQGEAMASFDLAAAVEPNSTLLVTEMARLQLKSAVAEEFARSFAGSGDVPVAEIALDNDDLLYVQLARHEEEVSAKPHHADVRYRYGVLLKSEGRLAEALEQFTAAVEINPTYVQAIIHKGITEQELGKSDDVIETFKTVLDIHPEFVDLHYRLGLLYTDRRELDQAVEHMVAAAEGAKDNQQIRAAMALSLQNMGLLDRAAATWRSLRQMHQRSGTQSGPGK